MKLRGVREQVTREERRTERGEKNEIEKCEEKVRFYMFVRKV